MANEVRVSIPDDGVPLDPATTLGPTGFQVPRTRPACGSRPTRTWLGQPAGNWCWMPLQLADQGGQQACARRPQRVAQATALPFTFNVVDVRVQLTLPGQHTVGANASPIFYSVDGAEGEAGTLEHRHGGGMGRRPRRWSMLWRGEPCWKPGPGREAEAGGGGRRW